AGVAGRGVELGREREADAGVAQAALDRRRLAVDRDAEACAAARRALAEFGDRVTIVESEYARVGALMEARGIPGFDAMLLDLGVSSPQIDHAARGFSFVSDGPLDMRMGRGGGPTAADLVNRLPEKELADILYRYGEERNSRRVARRIVHRRAERPFERTRDLAATIAGAFAPAHGRGRIHPATRSFMALRIVVNDELGELERFLADFPRFLAPRGRLAIISYHSLEDRIVKARFGDEARAASNDPWAPIPVEARRAEPRVTRVTRKPVRPAEDEIARNPRTRSAKLRVVERLEEPA
ncbi:MAG: 16S rRNA (cytosine(1402)-N(4))-methyltransferase RsmH, partial [Myxococcales bacterium]|nr:16S rRNA (cytosine(1402)-N(4))-methyltransferase RsmH [Myxococcales bacterium]